MGAILGRFRNSTPYRQYVKLSEVFFCTDQSSGPDETPAPQDPQGKQAIGGSPGRPHKVRGPFKVGEGDKAAAEKARKGEGFIGFHGRCSVGVSLQVTYRQGSGAT